MQKISDKMWKISVLIGVAMLCLLSISIVLSGVTHFKIGSQMAGINQVSNLSHLLVRQQAKLFSLLLIKNATTEELVEALNTFSEEEFVIDAHLYSNKGVLIAQSRQPQPFVPFQAENNLASSTQQIVEPILAQQDLIGFLRVTFDVQYGQTTQSKVNKLFHLLYAKLWILFLSGGLFVSCFYYFNRRKSTLVHSLTSLPIREHRRQTQRFHSRRRAFRRK